MSENGEPAFHPDTVKKLKTLASAYDALKTGVITTLGPSLSQDAVRLLDQSCSCAVATVVGQDALYAEPRSAGPTIEELIAPVPPEVRS